MADAVTGGTALSAAIVKGLPELTQAILGSGADLNSADNDKKTQLMHAILQGNPGLALQLVEMGADLGLRDKDSKTALLYAAEKLAVVVTRPPSLPPSLGALGPAWVYPCCHSEPSPPPPHSLDLCCHPKVSLLAEAWPLVFPLSRLRTPPPSHRAPQRRTTSL